MGNNIFDPRQGEWNSYQCGEGLTGAGQLVEFECHVGDQAGVEVRAFLSQKIRMISAPITGQVNVPHGGFGQYTRYSITQHEYAGGGYPGDCGWQEVLEIKDPPDGRWGIVINEYDSAHGSVFTEWETLEAAKAAHKGYWGQRLTETKKIFPSLPGFKRRMDCGRLTPWFYAVGTELLVGDFALTAGLEDDPVFRLGKKCLVFNEEGLPQIKTCLGTRHVVHRSDVHPYETRQYRVVCFDDGSCWDEYHHVRRQPIPLTDDRLWISDALEQFQRLLAGASTEFTIKFLDGAIFHGKLQVLEAQKPSPEGRYYVKVSFKGKAPKEGWVEFTPTDAASNITQHIINRAREQGLEVERVEITETEIAKGGKKWKGVFFPPPK